jgi:glycosyltransferase involved in cell wall biosynthesis
MANETFISIIIPFFGDIDPLKSLFETVPDESHLEVIIVDDNPTFTPLQSPFLNTKFTHISNSPEKYAGQARNKGISVAKGTWILFCDSDDLIETDGFQKLSEYLKKSDADLVYGGITSFSRGKTMHRTKGYENILNLCKKENDMTYLLRYHAPWGKFIRRNFLNENNILFEKTRVSNDVIFNARLHTQKPKCEIKNDLLYKVRESEASLTKQNTKKSIEERINVVYQYNKLLRDAGFDHLQVEPIKQAIKLVKKNPITFLKHVITTILKKDPFLPTTFSMKMRKYK